MLISFATFNALDQSQEFTAAYRTSAPPLRKRPSVSQSESSSCSSARSTPSNGYSAIDDHDDDDDNIHEYGEDDDDEHLHTSLAISEGKRGRLMSNRKTNRMKSSNQSVLNPILAAFQNQSSVHTKPSEQVVNTLLIKYQIRNYTYSQ